jgi:2-polyprenyl-6-methoxyphenol hydroxylase-like FAD-dependent oxidoreductase
VTKAAADVAVLVDVLQTHPTNLQVALAQFESVRKADIRKWEA